MNKELFLDEEILEFLKEKGEAPTSKISHLLKIGYYKLLMILKKLEQEGKIKSRKSKQGRVFNYWSLK